MKTLERFALLPVLLVTLLFPAASARAEQDPPSRVVRLKYMSGDVSMQPGGVDDWVAAVLNRPLTSADRVWTDKDARAELQLGSAALRMNAETSLTLTNISDAIVQLELDQGTLNLHIRHLFDGETYEVDTPNIAFTVLKAGDYRFDVDPNADTTYVTVWRGEGEANGQDRGVRVKSGRQATFTSGTSLEHHIDDAPGSDGFDDWCRVRDDREDHAQSYRYVSADVIGAEDLDAYGTWRVVGSYGPVWVPAVAPGWAPYRYGHWVWLEPWGWTWVDDAPWGFAPCHYGRWLYTAGFWAWAPGPIMVARPVYAPALVAWVGGPHVGVSLSVGGGVGVGWFPLGYGEPYVPAYAVSRGYFSNVNVTNTHITNITTVTNNYYITNSNTAVVQTNITNIHYANQTVVGAVTAVPQRVMVNAEPVGRAAVVLPTQEVKTTTVAMAAPVAPLRTSVLGVNAGTRTVAPRAVPDRPVASRLAPPARPIPFEAKQDALARNPGRPLDSQTESQIRSAQIATPRPAAQPVQAEHPALSPTAKPGTPPARVAHPAAPAMPAHEVPRPPLPNMPSQPANAEHTVPRSSEPGASREVAPAKAQGTTPGPTEAARPANTGAPDPPQRNVPRPPQSRNAGETSGSHPGNANPQPGPEPQPRVGEPLPRAAEPAPRSAEPSPPARPQYPDPPQIQPRQEGRSASRTDTLKHENSKPAPIEPRAGAGQPSHGTQKTNGHTQHTNTEKEGKKAS
jgi:hypothetical protein